MIPLDEIDDATAAGAFRRLVAHLRHREDAQNVDLMGLAGFCRNCLSEWLEEASDGRLSRDDAREAIYGEPYAAWKARQPAATPEQLARMAESQQKNAADAALDEALDESFPASDPTAMTEPAPRA